MTPNQTLKINKISKIKIANYDICPIPTGLFGLDGGAMFGTVPKVLWQKTNPADEFNRIQMEARALLLKSAGRNILIDTGNGSDFVAKYGEKLGSKFAEMYGVEENGPTLISSLKNQQLNPEDITDVILTHLHFDHAGGATTEKNGKIVPTFPNAKYYLQKKNLETAKNPNLRERASYFPANYQPLIDNNCLELLDGNQNEFLPGISVWVSHGHTDAHQVVIVEDNTTALFYCGDVIPTSSHVRLAWLMGYDLNPMKLIEEKKVILERALNKKTYLYFEHDPYCNAATIERNKEDYAVKERFHL